MTNINLTLYVVRNDKGQFFRAKGYGGGGQTWVDDINKAKIYGKIGGARGTITWFANTYPKFPTLELLKLTITGVEVIDETERVNKAKEKKIIAEANSAKRNAERELEAAKRDFDNARNRLSKLKGVNGRIN